MPKIIPPLSMLVDDDDPNIPVGYRMPDGSNVLFPRVLYQTGAPLSVSGTTAKTIVSQVPIPPWMLKANGLIMYTQSWTVTNNANSKGLKVELGGTAFYNATAASTLTQNDLRWIRNRNAPNSQVGLSTSGSGAFGTSGGALATSAVDTNARGNTLDFSIQLASGADTAVLEAHSVIFFPSPQG